MAPTYGSVMGFDDEFQALRERREAEERARVGSEPPVEATVTPTGQPPAEVVNEAAVEAPVRELASVSAGDANVSSVPQRLEDTTDTPAAVSSQPEPQPGDTPEQPTAATEPSSEAPAGDQPELSDELADEVNGALRPIGYPWPGGVVLTDVDDPRAKHVIEANLGFGMLVDGVGWVSLISPVGGLILPDNVPLEPVPKVWGKWVSMHGGVDGKVMGVFALNRQGRVVGATGTAKRSDLAVPLTMATLRTLEDRDDIPESAGDLVAPGTTRWAQGWSFSREKLLAV